MAEKASEETPSDNKPAVEIQKFPVDTSHASRKVWLIKIPLAIRDSWLKAPRDEIIGEIQPKNPKIGKNHMTVHMAPKYKVNIGSEFTVTEGECNQLQAFSINSDGTFDFNSQTFAVQQHFGTLIVIVSKRFQSLGRSG